MNGMQLTGSQIVIECLKEQGVDTVFGYPGGAILNVYDELYKHKNEITHILTSHEQGAAHAAHGEKADVSAHHNDVAVGEVQHLGNTINHGISKCDDCIDTAKTDAVF